MSDYTESNYTKTDKKVKSINYDSIDLTYNEIYDVFIDSDKDEFIIDDVGDKRYGGIDDKNYYELVDDVGNDIHDNNETKLKFKVGDKVKVVDDDYISAFTDNVKVGHTGIINLVDDDDSSNPYRVKFDELDVRNEWWFTRKCIDLVSDDVNTPNKKYNPLIVQQSGNHYKNGKIQPIEYSERNNLSMCQGNIVKYITRHKEKNGVDDLAKVVHYALLEALFVYGEDGSTELRDKVDSLINIGNN